MKFLGKKHQINKNKSFKESFLHAYDGISYVILKERNMHIHLIISLLVIVFGILLQISYLEFLICLILIGIVIALEVLNTSIEAVVDLITTKEDPLAKIAKDTSAGAVLVMSVIAALIGLIIFVPKIFDLII